MRYAYEDLSEDQFEHLIVVTCSVLLGPGIQPFSKGKDGGKDARFSGTAERHPSSMTPWSGVTIVQAKHTNGFNKHFSEADFFSLTAKSSVLTDELAKIASMRAKNELDHYMLFSNRKLSGIAEPTIRQHISTTCGIPQSSISLLGIESIELYMKLYPSIPVIAALDPVDSALTVDVDDLSSVVEALSLQKHAFASVADDPPVPRVAYESKNARQGMTRDFAEALARRYLAETPQVRHFLSLPDNRDLQKLYEAVADEFEVKIIAKRKDYQSFDDVFNYLTDLLFNRDPILRRHKRLTRLMLFYMYWNCDIGSVDAAAAN